MLDKYFYDDIKRSVGIINKAEVCIAEILANTNKFIRFFLRIFTDRLQNYDISKKNHNKALRIIRFKLNTEFQRFTDQIHSVEALVKQKDQMTEEQRTNLLRRLVEDQKHLVDMGDKLPPLPHRLSQKVKKTISSLMKQQVQLAGQLNPNNAGQFVAKVEKKRLREHLTCAPKFVLPAADSPIKFCASDLKQMTKKELVGLEKRLLGVRKKYISRSYISRSEGLNGLDALVSQVRVVQSNISDQAHS